MSQSYTSKTDHSKIRMSIYKALAGIDKITDYQDYLRWCKRQRLIFLKDLGFKRHGKNRFHIVDSIEIAFDLYLKKSFSYVLKKSTNNQKQRKELG